MRSDANKAAAGLFAVAGVLLVAAPWWPQPVPPLPARFPAEDPVAAPLHEALSRFDRTCARGDVAALPAVVTTARQRELERAAATLDRELDAAMLRQGTEEPLAEIVRGREFSGFARGDRACLVGRARDARGGSVAIVFERVDDGYRIDQVVHKPSLVAEDEAAVRAFAEAAMQGLRPR